MKTSLSLLLLLTSFFSSLALAAEQVSTQPSAQEPVKESKATDTAPVYFICKAGKEVRTIQVKVNEQKRCFVYYTKSGEQKQIGASQQLSKCQEIALKVKSNLILGKTWECREVKSHDSSNLNSSEEK